MVKFRKKMNEEAIIYRFCNKNDRQRILLLLYKQIETLYYEPAFNWKNNTCIEKRSERRTPKKMTEQIKQIFAPKSEQVITLCHFSHKEQNLAH